MSQQSTTPLPVRPTPAAALLAVALGLLSCGGGGADSGSETGAEWRRLALSFAPEPGSTEAREWSPRRGGAPALHLSAAARAGERRVEALLLREDWTARGAGAWTARRPANDLGAEPGAEPPRLVGGDLGASPLGASGAGTALPAVPPAGELPDAWRARLAELDAPAYAATGDLVLLALPGGGEPPPEIAWSESISLGFEENGAWRVAAGRVVADGLPVLAGEAVELVCDVPPRSVLRVATVARAPVGPDRRARFRVLLDGAVLLEHDERLRPNALPVAHRIALAPEHRIDARLRFEVEGPACLGAFLTPTLAPAEAPERSGRPDVVVLLADTFRADNLAAWGGDPEIAPHLNRFAAGARRYLGARCPSTWTLPSHAAFLSGVYPRQASVTERAHSLGAGAHTLAEHFSAAGYRTVAVTERGFVSRSYGLAQGFEWFEEHGGKVEHTLARALELEGADDGRPLLLFVHSYRAHYPYKVSAETRRRLEGYSFEGDNAELTRELSAAPVEEGAARGAPFGGRRAELAERLEALYRGASADLDERFGELLATLEERGRLDGSVVVLTSDHGESFGEQGVFFHGLGAWREEALVPLAIRAPGLTPGDVEEPVSLVGLPRTLARLAGLEPHGEWLGPDLTQLTGQVAAVATYQCSAEQPTDVALVAGSTKLVLRDAPAEEALLRFAYDLAVDPAERASQPDAEWAREALARWGPTLEALAVPLLERGEAALDAEQQKQLEELGYAGGEGDERDD